MNNRVAAGGAVSAVVAIAALALLTAFGITEAVPVGSIRAWVAMGSDKPLPNLKVVVRTWGQSEDQIEAWVTTTDENGMFELYGLPTGLYTVSAQAEAHAIDDEIVGVYEGVNERIWITAEANYPRLEVYASQSVFAPDESPSIVATGLIQDDSIQIKVLRVSEEHLARNGSLYDLSYNLDSKKGEQTKLEQQRSLDYEIESRSYEGVFTETVRLDPLPPGIYIVRIITDVLSREALLNITEIALVTKSAGGQCLAYVTDIETGRAIGGAKIQSWSGERMVDVGVTDATGRLSFPITVTPDEYQTSIRASHGPSIAYTGAYVDSTTGEPHAFWTQTDRPVYRPGDTVRFRTAIRIQRPDGYAMPSGGTALATLLDEDGNQLASHSLPLTGFGTVNGEFEVNDYMPPGSYQINIEYAGETGWHYVQIAEYRKPQFEVIVEPAQPHYTNGERLEFQVACEYYTGEPLAGAKVQATLTRSQAWSTEWYEDDWAPWVEEYAEYGEVIEEYELATDEMGRATVRFIADADGDQMYTLRADVADPSGRVFSGSGSVEVTAGAFELDARLEKHLLQPGESTVLLVSTLEHGSGEPMPGITVELEVGRQVWSRNSYDFTALRRLKLTTDADGTERIELRAPDEGDLVARVVARDARGNEIHDSATSWVWTRSGAPPRPGPSLSVVLDKSAYDPGDTATALITTDQPGGQALVTLEAETVRRSWVIDLGKGSASVQLDGLEELAPNAFVSVSYVRDKQYSEAGKELRIDLTRRRLNVLIEPLETEVQPGETIGANLRVTDESGNPVRAEVAVGVVDEGVYAILEDTNDPLDALYPRRWNAVFTSHSFPEIMLDAESKAGDLEQMRRQFEDTAFWAPSIVTDAYGEAYFETVLPDNLTRWRITATAIDKQTHVGKSTAFVTASKPLMARLSLPAFLVDGDYQKITGSITNDTSALVVANVRLDVSGVQVADSDRRRVRIAAHSTEDLTWTITAIEPGIAVFTLTARSASESDILRKEIVIKPHGREYVASESGQIENEAITEALEILPNAYSGELTIQIEPSLISGLIGSLDYLVDYPYGCVEQTMSRFMPAVAVADLLDEVGLERPELETRIPDVVARSMVRLRELQNTDGGFGWWSNDDSDPAMTALVLDGLWRADNAGIETDARIIASALDWAGTRLKQTTNANDSTYLAAAVLLYGQSAAATRIAQNTEWSEMDTVALAQTAAALTRAKRPELAAPAYRELESRIERLEDMALVNERAEWYEQAEPYVFEALAARDPSGDLTLRLLRYLMRNRSHGRWESTKSTAAVVYGAINLISDGDYGGEGGTVVSVTLNGKPVKIVTLGGLEDTAKTMTIPVQSLQRGKVAIGLRADGGEAFYSVTLRQVVAEDEFKPTSAHGLSIKREYFSVRARRYRDGTIRTEPSARPVTSAQSGDVLRCRLTIKSDTAHEFLILEDPIPSNCRTLEDGVVRNAWEWSFWWSDATWYDDRATFFIRSLPAGAERVIEYAIRAESPGLCSALPATISGMYVPEIRASTGGLRLEVRP